MADSTYIDQSQGEGAKFIKAHESQFGGKTIGAFAGIALLINNITGPGVPGLPNMFSEAGWLSPTITFIIVWIMSSVSATMYCEAMRRIPGNEHFISRLEYTSIVDYYFGRRWYLASQVGLNGALQSLNIVSVMQSAQVMDAAIAAITGVSCAVNISPFPTYSDTNHTLIPDSTSFLSCISLDQLTANNGESNPWGCHLVISIGYAITLAMAIPMGIYNLDDNMIVQVIAFILTIGCWLVWFGASIYYYESAPPVDWSLEAINSTPYGSQAGVLGTILFNFGFVTTIPSWVNEKKPSVSVNKVVWISTTACIFIFFALGIPGALAFGDVLQGPGAGSCKQAYDNSTFNCQNDMMAALTSSPASKGLHFVLAFSVYLFPIVAIVSSIPVFSIVIKYNCMENGMSKRFSVFWGVVFPWLVSIPLMYQPSALQQFINFSSLIFVSFTDFVVPWGLYIVMLRSDKSLRSMNTVGYIQDFDINKPAATESDGLLSRGGLNFIEHFAIPPSWGLSSATKSSVSLVLVVLMTLLSIAGTVLSVQTNVAQGNTNSWDCAGVGGS